MKTSQAQSDLVYSISNDNLHISISCFLKDQDYKDTWAGDNGEDGFENENVLKLRSILDEYVNEGSHLDLQIWEEGNAFAQGLNPAKLNELKSRLEVEYNQELELSERC